ncbi:MAG: hypothetical protein ACLFU8_10570 [Anaerolineales bacterium]
MRKTVTYLAVLFLVIASLACNRLSPVRLNVVDKGACVEFDEDTREPIGVSEEFDFGVDQVMAYFYVETNIKAPLHFRFYLDDVLFNQASTTLIPGYNYAAFIPDTGLVPPGHYRVVAFVGDTEPLELGVVEFEVVD